MPRRIEHFVHGAAARLKRFRAGLPAGVEVSAVPGGLVLREPVSSDTDSAEAIARIEDLARAQGLEYDGHGEEFEVGNEGKGPDLEPRSFADRTGIAAGHGFAIPLPGGRFGHAVHLGSDRRGYLLLEISTLVTEQPAAPDALRKAPRRYRQPILVWHTGFAALPLASGAPLAQLPCTVVFRCGIGWPDPEEISRLERRFRVTRTDTPESWDALLTAMAGAGARLPGIEGYSLWTARVGRTGILKLQEDYTIVHFADEEHRPMPWQPAAMDEITSILAGGPDLIASRDQVT